MATNKQSLRTLGIRKVDEQSGISEYRLDNGLKILLRENRSAPVVSFMIVYRVGSRNEAVGHTGSTHFLEHMMFKGTRKFNPKDGTGVMEILARIGALRNATTWLDRTNYFECVGSEYLPLCIEIEADRMRNLNLRQDDRDSEMTVVRNEFERGENQPAWALSKEVMAAAFREHPYHHPTIGWRSDVEGVPLARLREFYDTYYWPNNATVIVVGDFDTDGCLRLVNKHFGKIPRSSHPIPEVYTVEPPQEGERRVEVRRAGDLEQLMMVWHIPEADHPDTYPLAVMSAILGDSGKRSSRLYKALMETGLVTSISAHNGEFRDPHVFAVSAVLAPGKTASEVEQAIEAEIARLAGEKVSADELDRVKKANRKGTTIASSDPQTFANLLCIAESVATWQWLMEYDDKYDAVTAEDVMRVAGTYFDQSNRTVGHFIPTSEGTGKALHHRALEQGSSKSGSRAKAKAGAVPRPGAGSRGRFELPASASRSKSFADRVVREVLPNGLTVLAMANPGTGSVALFGATAAGDCFAPPDQSLLPTLTAMMLTRGSSKYSKEDLAKILESMGVRLSFGSDRFMTGFGALTVKDDFPAFAELVSEVVRNPRFLEEELAQVCREVEAWLTRSNNDTGRRVQNAFLNAAYPEGHPFHEKSFDDQLVDLRKASPLELRAFHRQHYSPKATVISVVGDIDPAKACQTVSSAFGAWTGPERKHPVLDVVDMPSGPRTIDVNLPDKANVDIVIGHPTVLSRKSKEYFAAQLANAALGKDTISARLGKVVRVEHGLTYGVYCSFDDASYGNAPWSIDLSVNPENVSKALSLVGGVVDQYLKKGISAAELEDEAGRLVGNFKVALRSSEGIAHSLTRFEFTGLGLEAMDSLTHDYMSVKRSDVNEAIRKYFHPERAITVRAGTMEKVK